MTAPKWATHSVPVFAGQHDTHRETGEDYAPLTAAEVMEMSPTNRPKSRGLAFIPSLYRDYDARCHRVQWRKGAFVALTGDIDSGDHSLERIEQLVRHFAAGAAWRIWSSPNSRPGDRRWRIIIMLDAPITPALWVDAQKAFYLFMESKGVKMDHALARAGQPIYLPNVPSIHAKTGERLRGRDGRPLYFVSATTGTSAPGLDLGAGLIARGIAWIAQHREAAERERERVQAEAQRKRSLRAKEGGGSLIDSFNRANAVCDLLANYGYAQSPRNAYDWRSPLQTGESFATRVMDHHKWVSLSQSDADAGIGARSASGCYGDGFDLFAYYEHGGNRGAALRQLRAENIGAAA